MILSIIHRYLSALTVILTIYVCIYVWQLTSTDFELEIIANSAAYIFRCVPSHDFSGFFPSHNIFLLSNKILHQSSSSMLVVNTYSLPPPKSVLPFIQQIFGANPDAPTMPSQTTSFRQLTDEEPWVVCPSNASSSSIRSVPGTLSETIKEPV